MRYATALLPALVMTVPSAGRAQVRWTVDATPVVDIAGTSRSGAVMFATANWATRLASGTIVVADAGGPALHFFDEKGTRIRSTGRRGRGPGDFTTVTWVAQCARDSVFAWDFVQARATVFDSTGAVGRTFSFGATAGLQVVAACNRSGALAQSGVERQLPASTPSDPKAGFTLISRIAPIQLTDLTGKVTGSVGELPAGQMITGGTFVMPRPLGSNTSWALSADRLFVGTGDSASIAVYGLNGARISSLAVRAPVRAPSREQFERAAEKLLSIIPGRMREPATKWLLATPMPARLPLYSGLFSDPENLLWVVLSVPGDKDTRLQVLRSNGVAVAEVVIPASLTVFEIGTDYVLGSREDSGGEQHVLLFRFRRGRSS